MRFSLRLIKPLFLASSVSVAVAACGADADSSTSATSGAGGATTSSSSTGTGGNGGGTGGATATTSSSSAGTGGAGGGDGKAFPTTPGNVFSLQYRNSTDVAITVWFEGSQPPCSSANALQCDSVPGGVPWNPADYTKNWAALKSVFAASGTHFFVLDASAQSHEVDVSNRIDLEPGETLRVQLPIKDGHPEWYFARNGVSQSVGTKGWVTKKGVSMPASERALLFEYNVQAKEVYWDLSAVDGLNANGTMNYEGPGCAGSVNCKCDSAMPKKCSTNLDAFTDANDGCPYITTVNGAKVCSNPKFYATVDAAVKKPSWVVPASAFTTDSVSTDYPDIWNKAGKPSGADMASAPSGDSLKKQAYHIWWATNVVGKAWLKYLQANAAGTCDAYGWAYDEMKWKAGDTFDQNGNPSLNTTISPLVRCDLSNDTYVNIDVTKVM